MLINEYLEFRFGCIIPNKYNKLVLEEIVSNPSVYPLLSDYLDEMKEALENKDYSLARCVDDDLDSEFNVFEGQQLLCAFLIVFAQQNRGKKFELLKVTCGKKFMPNQSLNGVVDQYGMVNNGHEYYSLDRESILREYCLHYHPELHSNKTIDTYFGDFEPLLNNIQGGLINSLSDSIIPRFDYKDLQRDELGNYPVWFYGFTIKTGKDIVYLTYYNTEGGFDGFNWIYLDMQNQYEKCIH